MYPDDLIERAVHSASRCEAQGFHETAKSLRALAEEMRLVATTPMMSPGFGEHPVAAFQQRS
ncbi:hypothetical protein [Antarctobacter heliothermus]|uniref:Uncharacterized protein n=1 Tax=Antarctobacter heliothermus TaxID=74033 RepID=A0A239H9K9_9RHOB|nr:hypothetical protein [Antarctobacter heliothermus]SNS77851.1 hypothetical protein SAMN04488078_10325 [Antarctobacter heliothermus]